MDEEINEFSPENSPKSDMVMMMPSPPRDMAPISPPETTITQPEAITAVVEPEEKEEIKSSQERHRNERSKRRGAGAAWSEQLANEEPGPVENDFQALLNNYSRNDRHHRDRSESMSSSSSSRHQYRDNAERWKTPDEVGKRAYGKELSLFDVLKCGTRRVKVVTKFENTAGLDKAMGVELLNNQMIICNTFKNVVDFLAMGDPGKTNGKVVRTIPDKGPYGANDYQPVEPSQCTILHSGQTVLLDAQGITIFAAERKQNTGLCEYRSAMLSRQFTTKGKPGKCFGLFTTRLNKVGTFIDDDKLGPIICWITNIDQPCSAWELNEAKIDFGCFTSIRFAACHGNTIALSDMSKSPKLWLVDLNGKIRHKIRLDEYDARQPAGVCFDAGGNILLSDSKAAKIMVFDRDGEFQHELDVLSPKGASGYLKGELQSRLTDIAINDKGRMVILCPLPLSRRGRIEKSFLFCEFQTKSTLSNDEQIVKEGAVTKKMKGIFVEATVDDSIKNDFDREWDQMASENHHHHQSPPPPPNRERPQFGHFPPHNAERRAQPMTMRQEQPAWLSRGGGGGGGRGGGFNNRKRDRPFDHQHEPPRKVEPKKSWGDNNASSWGGGNSPKQSSSSWGGASPPQQKSSWGNDDNDKPSSSTGGGWGAGSPDNTKSSSGGGGWGASPDNDKPSVSGWGAASKDDKPSGSGWGSSPDKPAGGGGGGWGSSPDNQTTATGWGVANTDKGSSTNDDKPAGASRGWGSSPDNDKPATTGNGWGANSSAETKTVGWGTSTSDNEKATGGDAGWGAATKPSSTGWGGAAETDKSSSGWGNVESDAKKASGWGGNQATENNDPWAGDTNSGVDKEEEEKISPQKPQLVNQPPVEACVDEKNDPRVAKNKKRISLSAYRERKQSTSVDPDQPVDEQVVEEEEKEPTEPNPDANDIPQLEFSTDEGSDEAAGSNSPTSPVFEEATTVAKEQLPELPTAPQIDAELSRSIIDELESDITQPDLLMDTQIEDPESNKPTSTQD